MAKRILNRKDLRADFDAAERRRTDEEQDEVEEEAGDEDEGEEAEEEAEAEDEAGEEEEEEKPKPKKKPAKPKTTKPRSRAAKVVRMRVVWGVFDNSNRCVATFEYPRRTEAAALAEKLTADKKNTHFIQPVKEPLEEKKDK